MINNTFEEDREWTEFNEKFANVYDDLNYTKSLQGYAMRAGHKMAESAFKKTDFFGRVLEIGAGTGEHLPFVRHQFDEYVLSDMSPEPLEVAKKKLEGLHDGKLKFELQTGEKLSYEDNSFDRLIAAHVLEHIYYPHLALKEWSRVVKDGGIMTILLPTDPSFAWRFSRNLGPRKNAHKQNIAYDYVMARQHVNSCNGLIAFLRHYFPKRKESWWPCRVPFLDINLFFVYQAVVSK